MAEKYLVNWERFNPHQHGRQKIRTGARSLPSGYNIFIERLWRSVTYEEVYFHAYDTVAELRAGVGRYANPYNRRRPYSSSKAKTPDQVFYSQPPLTVAE